ncbi:hypothetical protein [Dorea longicatena]|uniref:hypothetical protein n=1 Tax=Dorea longicatena TaxID=88431 RepID=UPI0004818A84|nr:hypothetical protein [Dorea longicatena]
MYTSRRLCIYQLEDVYISGTVSPDHLGPHASAYTMLIPELQEELDVTKRMNLWMKSDTDLKVMMPYLSQYLGHKGPVETYYYYHQVQEIFETIRRKDKISSRVIPEVQYEKD